MLDIAFLVLCVLLLACDADTGGELGFVQVQVQAVGEGDTPAQFETRHGYRVELSEARMVIGPVYVWAPSGAQASRSLSLVSVAHAHGGYDPLSGRRVRVERTAPFVVDMTDAEPAALGEESAELGSTEEATLTLPPPPDGLAEATRGHHLWARGRATKGDFEVEFEGGVDIADDGLLRRVNAIEASEPVADGDTVTLQVRPRVIFDAVHFDRLQPAEDEPFALLRPNTQAYDAIFLGMTDPAAFAVTIGTED